MAIQVSIDNQLPDGSGPPPHLTVENADFMPNVGDILIVTNSDMCRRRMLLLSPEGKPGVHSTVSPEK